MMASQTDSSTHSQGDRPDEDEFVCLFVQYQRVLFAYLRTALGTPVDAEEVLQETSVILWRERRQFVLGTNFVNWATTIAQNQVRKFRRNRKHIPQLLNEELLDQMAAEVAAQCDLIESRRQALEQCLETLSQRDRGLIDAAYGVNDTKKSVGQRLGMTPNVFYKALNRIRQRLLKCIRHRLMAEGRT
jgi:RNA polymerase sigma-70 factor, ECF subfamily